MSGEESDKTDERIIQYKTASEAGDPIPRRSKYAGGGKYRCDNTNCINCYPIKKPSKRFLCKIWIHDFHRVETKNGFEYICRFCGESEPWGM